MINLFSVGMTNDNQNSCWLVVCSVINILCVCWPMSSSKLDLELHFTSRIRANVILDFEKRLFYSSPELDLRLHFITRVRTSVILDFKRCLFYSFPTSGWCILRGYDTMNRIALSAEYVLYFLLANVCAEACVLICARILQEYFWK